MRRQDATYRGEKRNLRFPAVCISVKPIAANTGYFYAGVGRPLDEKFAIIIRHRKPIRFLLPSCCLSRRGPLIGD
jgi:hypothetical protein